MNDTLHIKPPKFWKKDVNGEIVFLPKSKDAASQKVKKRLDLVNLSEDQRVIYDALAAWCKDEKSRFISVGGYAGTGKSTLIAILARIALSEKKVAFCAFSGKAGNVLRQKFSEAGVILGTKHCGTIHSLIYTPIIDEKTGALICFESVDKINENIVVVDEASMIGKDIWTDLNRYGVKILAVGDHGQLPPIGKDSVNLLETPDLRLEKIHRQARGNPILELATHVRNGGNPATFKSPDTNRVSIQSGVQSRRVRLLYKDKQEALNRAVLCYKNTTRNKINRWARNFWGFYSILQPDDIVICLRNVNIDGIRLFNGMRGIVREVKNDPISDLHLRATIDFPDDNIQLRNGRLFKPQFGFAKTLSTYEMASTAAKTEIKSWFQVGLLFDHAYCMTVHKAQGSQFEKVIVINEQGHPSETLEMRSRWLYTSVTRASKSIEICV